MTPCFNQSKKSRTLRDFQVFDNLLGNLVINDCSLLKKQLYCECGNAGAIALV